MFFEKDCTITHQGKTFEAGGAWLAQCSDGKWRGVVYVNTSKGTVTDWHGNHIAKVRWSNYRGNFCKMRRVSFTYQGSNFVGDYCPDWADACKVRSTK